MYRVRAVNGTETGDPEFVYDHLQPRDVSHGRGFFGLSNNNKKRESKAWKGFPDPPVFWKPSKCLVTEDNVGHGPKDLDHHSYDGAKAALKAQCVPGHDYVHDGYNYYAIDGCVVVYFCHFNNKDLRNRYDIQCKPDDIDMVMEKIDDECGLWRSGQSDQIQAGNGDHKVYYIAIGREQYCTSNGHNFCAHGAG